MHFREEIVVDESEVMSRNGWRGALAWIEVVSCRLGEGGCNLPRGRWRNDNPMHERMKGFILQVYVRMAGNVEQRTDLSAGVRKDHMK